MKTCTKCQETKELTEFHKHPDGKDGLSAQCKSCFYQYTVEWRKKNREYFNAYQRDYKAKNPEMFKIAAKKYRDKNKDKINKKVNKWREENTQEFTNIQLNYQSKLPPSVYIIKYRDTVVYVGSSNMPLRRVNCHLSTIKSATNLTAVNKLHSYCGYEKADFTYKIVEECKVEDLLEREKYWENHYDAKTKYNELFSKTPSITEIMKANGTHHYMNRKK